MATITFANKFRPKRFSEVVGQDAEIEVLKKIVAGGWKPNAIMLTGPFGTGKTTLARLLARAMHCSKKEQDADGILCEPCGVCSSCLSMETDSNPSYIEVDAASQGAVNDVRLMKDLLSYQTGTKIKIICYDESHMLSAPAQNALLQTLEEGSDSVLFIFCTTESNKMLPTVQSRCIVLNMKLLTPAQIWTRLEQVAKSEGLDYEMKSLKIIGSYVRGHARDALVMLEQLSRMAPVITEELTRSYLRLDRHVEVYKLLSTVDKKESLEQLEVLLCNHAPSELTQTLGEIFVNAYKLNAGINNFTNIDKGWLEKVLEIQGVENLLDKAEKILSIKTDYATIDFAIAAIGNVLLEGKFDAPGVKISLKTNTPPTIPQTAVGVFRKPKAE